MRKPLYLLILVIGLLLIMKPAYAGTIFRPVFNTGLVGYWNFEEGAGGGVYDKSGYGNHGTWNGTAGVINENFEANPGSDGYDMTGWTETVGAGSIVDEDNTEVARPTGGGNQVLKIQKVSPNFDARAYRSFAQPKPVTFIAFNIYITEADVDTWASSPLAKVFSNLGENVWEFKVEKYPSYYNFLFGITYESSWHAGRYENFSFNTWYLIEVKYDATNKKAEFRVNGNSISTFSWSGDTYADINVLSLGDTDVSKVLTAYYDLVKVSTTGWNQGYWVNGKIGGGGSFNGTDNYVEIADDSDLSFGNSSTDTPMTISAWIKMTDASNFKIVSKGEYGAGTIEYYFRVGDQGDNTDNLLFRIYDNGAALGREYTTVVTAYEGQWIHVAVTYDGSETTAGIKLYLNGARVDDADYNYSSGYIAMHNLNAAVWIGRYDTYYSNGLIDETRVYNRALSAGEIQRTYNLSQPKMLTSPSAGLVGYWSFDEGSGSKVGDFSNQGNAGTWYGSGTSHWTDGKLGKAGNFNGSDDYVSVPYTDSLKLSYPSALSFWINFVSSSNGGIINTGTGGSTANFSVMATSAGRLFVYDTSTHYFSPDYYLPKNQWVYITVKYVSASKTDLYVSGVYYGTATGGLGPTTQNLMCFGADCYFSGTENVGMKLDEVRIYKNRDLDQSEITALYNSGLAKINASQNNQLTNGLVGFWSFNGSDIDGNEAIDRSGNGNNGTITGATKTIGQVGQALNFGNLEYVSTPVDDQLDGISKLTISAWMRKDNTAKHITVGRESDDYNDGVNIQFYTDGKVYFEAANPGYGTFALNDTDWHHFVMVYDGTLSGDENRLKGYIDGVQRTLSWASPNVPETTETMTVPFLIGPTNDSALDVDGSVDEVRIYNRALTAQEILRLYNMGH